MIRSWAPTRISFAGGGTDIPEIAEKIGGCVTSAAINKYTCVELKKRSDNKICISSVGIDGRQEKTRVTAGKITYNGRLDLAKAVTEELNIEKKGFDIAVKSSVPRHSGLGASGSAFVALIGAFSRFYNISMDRKEIAEIAFRLEREKLKNRVGRQDQYAAAFGGLNFMEFGKRVKITPLKIGKETLLELEKNIIVVEIAKRRKTAGDVVASQIKSFSVNEGHFRKTRELGIRVKQVLESGDLEEFGSVISDAWECKKMFGGVTTDFIDRVYETAVKNGAYGGKLSGAGGGGCGFFFCRHGKKRSVKKSLERLGVKNIPFSFDFHGLVVRDE